MKVINNLKEYLNEENTKIVIFDSKLYVSNYKDIKSFDSNKFILETNNKKVTLNGKNITIKKLTKEELLISGDIETIELGWIYG